MRSLEQIVPMWRSGELACDFLQETDTPHLRVVKGAEVVLEEPVMSRLDADERASKFLSVVVTGRLK